MKKLTYEFVKEGSNNKSEDWLLDIWIPSLNKAIEFNGEYWHENRKFEDSQKETQCKEKNIDLLIIWYQDWVNNREKQIEKLKEFLIVKT